MGVGEKWAISGGNGRKMEIVGKIQKINIRVRLKASNITLQKPSAYTENIISPDYFIFARIICPFYFV